MLDTILTIGSAIASIVSLFISLGDKFPDWKKYAHPISWSLGGFFLGRISSTLPTTSTQLFSNSYSAGFLLIIFLTVLVIGLLTYFFAKQDLYQARVFFVVGAIALVPAVTNAYANISVSIPPEDYLISKRKGTTW